MQKHIEKDYDHYFCRFEIPIEQSDLEAFEVQLTEMVCEFERWWELTTKDWRFGMPCTSHKYGACFYVPKCHAGNTGGYYERDVLFEELE